MYIIIGQGAAGTSAANTLKKIDGNQEVTIISQEYDSYYSRIDLPDVVSGKYNPEDAILQDEDEFRQRGIDCCVGESVKCIKPDSKTVELVSGRILCYKKLLIATGSVPVIPRLEGSAASGIHCLWTMEQARSIVAAAKRAKAAVVVGAGLIGLKTALALQKRGLQVTVVEKMPQLLPQQLDETGSAIIFEKVEAAGVKVLTGAQVNAFEVSGGAVNGVVLDGKRLACDFVVVAVGVKPNTTMANEAGIKVRKGIVTDQFLTTSNPDIYAAGDVAEVVNVISGRHILSATWPAAVEQGSIAACNMTGSKTVYEGYLTMNSVEIAGVPVVSAGDIFGNDGDEIFITRDGNRYKRLVVRDNIIRGLLFMGEIRQAGVLVNNIMHHTKIEDHLPLSKAFSFADLLAL